MNQKRNEKHIFFYIINTIFIFLPSFRILQFDTPKHKSSLQIFCFVVNKVSLM